ncbi:ABC transporter ATP-binding protein [Rhodobacter lacus]|uniref:ABC transporter ATP-binding protein n=1 Tax=Rhodobacter lacus TaxID=1641972 RepID=A0ABW5AC22_9RHOB
MTTAPVLELDDIHVSFETLDGTVEAVKGVSFHVARGETVAVVGESGSGKSQIMMGVMGLLAPNGRIRGRADFHGTGLIGLPRRALNRIRGERIAMIFQEPMTSLDPLFTIGAQLIEPLRRHQGLSHRAAHARAIELLRLVQIPEPEQRMSAWPHELSGGQRQRVMIAMAISNNPELLIADEPTTALDVTIQAEILTLLRDLQQRLGMAIVFITHDLHVVRRIADRVVVMRRGEKVEEGPVEEVFARPQNAYTRALIDAEPEGRKPPVAADAPVVLEVKEASVTFGRRRRRLFQPVEPGFRAVNGLSLSLRRGETIGIVGESGSGKSTLARAILRLVPASGTIRLHGRAIEDLSPRALLPLRRDMQVVMQDPFGSLSPRMTAGRIVAEGLLVHHPQMSAAERDRAAAAALAECQFDPSLRNRYPHEFSGGQRQRIAIARALVLKPSIIVLDEPTSALDRQVQKQIVDLLRRLQAEHGLSYLFISHDLAVVRALSDRVMVLKSGALVEEGSCAEVIGAPRQDYTRRLVQAAFLA